jgi:RNA polymerase sigma-70 factor (ECF subfamily)
VLGWIMNQARSRAIDRLRFDQRKERVDAGLVFCDELDEAMDPRNLLELKQLAQALRNAFGILTPEERQALEAAFFAGLTHAEIAMRLGEPLGTVKTRIRTALQKMRRAVNAEEHRP